MRWRRQVTIPASVRDALALEPGERVLAVAMGTGAGGPAGSGDAVPHIIATDRALHIPEAGGLARIPYESIAKVSWDGELAALTVVRPEPGGRLDLPLAEPGYVPETVRERVQSTIIYSQHVSLDGRRGVVVSARRAPGTLEARWVVAFDTGLDRNDPLIRERAERAVAELRAQTGI
ncbi:MAG: hypothetical protein ACRDWG_14525 [Actinomycetes bacterium]